MCTLTGFPNNIKIWEPTEDIDITVGFFPIVNGSKAKQEKR